MLFNSSSFLLFFVIVYGLYLALGRSYRRQNVLLLAASYYFYGYWNWALLGLLGVTTLVNYWIALRLGLVADPAKRRLLVALATVFDLGVLGFFKYFNFFSASLTEVLRAVGLGADPVTLNLLLPVGISFYTFQVLGYVVDVYRGDYPPQRNLIDFALFISFFPQLVAGPIERGRNLMPQIVSTRRITAPQFLLGLQLVLWGYFQKVVIADNCGLIADRIFGAYTQYQGLDLVVGILAFTVQIFCDFAGYTDIARGLAKMMGFELMLNFRLPYFSQNPRQFWARWHISLSTWLRDYLYIPLGGSRKGRGATYRNLLLTMGLCGLWHGAAWNFVIWGAYHGALLALHRLIETHWPERWRIDRPAWRAVKTIFFFGLVVLGWVFFRSRSLDQAVYMLAHAGLTVSALSGTLVYQLILLSLPLVAMGWWQKRNGDLAVVTKKPMWAQAAVSGLVLAGILVLGVRDRVEFIYFQF